eukprot:327109_1
MSPLLYVLCSLQILQSTVSQLSFPAELPSTSPTIFIPANTSQTIPDGLNISTEICIFGSHHSFLDGTYVYKGWNKNINGPIYYDERENLLLYPQQINDYIYQWQLRENYDSTESYSYCDMEISNSNRFYVELCPLWKTDFDQSENYNSENDKYMTVSKCDSNPLDQNHSITFEIETLSKITGGSGAVEMTLFWEDNTYKCTIYPTYFDGDYSCNTI